MKQLIFIILALVSFNSIGALQYEVKFEGVTDQTTLNLLTETLSENHSTTEAALRRRAESDIPNLNRALQSLAYYNPKLFLKFDFETSPIQVTYFINTGPVYPLAKFEIKPNPLNIRPHELGIILNNPAYPKDILKAEDNLLHLLEQRGYPLSKIVERKVIADQKTHEITVSFDVDHGPLTFFGATTITGNSSVQESFIRRKIQWCEGDVYDPLLIDCTIQALEAANLFGSITITHDDELTDDNRLSMFIDVDEGKHRSIGFGLSLSTQRGPGFTAEWEHRNFRGIGEKLGFDTNLWEKKQEATVFYVKPDFMRKDQDLITQVEYDHESTEGFTKSALTFSGIVERQLNSCTRISYGGQYTQLRDSRSDNDGNFNLFKVPLLLRWSNVDDPLDPKCGATLLLKSVPTTQLLDSSFGYSVNTVTASIYRPICNFVIAGKAMFGTILGASRRSIPPSERFYAGSENTLRGYKYLTVSPLDSDHDPIGGRSLMIYTVEGRFKTSENLGWAAFYDIGNVFEDCFPRFDRKMLQSVGVGVRYYTPVGPLRFDVAFPLNRRSKVDNRFQAYLSIGQSF